MFITINNDNRNCKMTNAWRVTHYITIIVNRVCLLSLYKSVYIINLRLKNKTKQSFIQFY